MNYCSKCLASIPLGVFLYQHFCISILGGFAFVVAGQLGVLACSSTLPMASAAEVCGEDSLASHKSPNAGN